ncbi:MAG TPA: hypothetical protein VJH33_02500, partial [Candidatus Paceibacterota bacterium]
MKEKSSRVQHMIVALKQHDSVEVDAEETEQPKETGPMAGLMLGALKKPSLDDVVEGPIVALGRARVFVDIHPFGTGIIYGREYLS